MSEMKFLNAGQAAEGLAARQPSISPKLRWLESLIDSGVDTESQILEKFLECDIESSSEPHEALSMVDRRPTYILEREFILQLDEVVDVSVRERSRLNFESGPRSTFKFMLNNAGLPLIGVVQERIPGISIDTVGVKLKVSVGTSCHYGVFLLSPGTTTLLGGSSARMVSKREQFILERRQQREQSSFRHNVEICAHRIPDSFLTVQPELIFKWPDFGKQIFQTAESPLSLGISKEIVRRDPTPHSQPVFPAEFTPLSTGDLSEQNGRKAMYTKGEELFRQPKEDGKMESRRPQPGFHPKQSPRQDAPLDPRALDSLPETSQIRMVHVSATVFCIVDFTCDRGTCACGADLDGLTVISVKGSLITAMMECQPADYAELPGDIQGELVIKCERRLHELQSPLLVIDQGSGPVRTRFVLTSGAHEANAQRF
jgi:hypothetical protein